MARRAQRPAREPWVDARPSPGPRGCQADRPKRAAPQGSPEGTPDARGGAGPGFPPTGPSPQEAPFREFTEYILCEVQDMGRITVSTGFPGPARPRARRPRPARRPTGCVVPRPVPRAASRRPHAPPSARQPTLAPPPRRAPVPQRPRPRARPPARPTPSAHHAPTARIPLPGIRAVVPSYTPAGPSRPDATARRATRCSAGRPGARPGSSRRRTTTPTASASPSPRRDRRPRAPRRPAPSRATGPAWPKEPSATRRRHP